MDSFDDVNWDKLSEPQVFFNLDDGFDKKDLKRSYNKLIKQFKPEKFPEEFQKIRKAYEEILDFLRDGFYKKEEDQDPGPSHSSVLEDYNEISDEFGYDDIIDNAKEEDPHIRESIDAEREKLLSWLDEKPLEEFYNALKENPEKPINYYHLAIVSDVVAGEEDFIFWILKGIKKFGFENEILGEILNEVVKKISCRDDWKEKALVFSKNCPASLYFQCLSDLMSELGHSMSNAEFMTLLDDCESSLDFSDDYLSDKCYFDLKIVIEFALKGDMPWLEKKYEYINQHQDLLSEPAYEYFELIESLFAYREMILVFGPEIKKNELVNAMSNCIEAFCTRDGVKMDQSFLVALSIIEKSQMNLMSLLEFNAEGSYIHLIFHIFFFIASTQSARLPFDDELEVPDDVKYEIASLVNEIDKKTNASFVGSIWTAFNWCYMGLLACVGLLPLLLFLIIDIDFVVIGIQVAWVLSLWYQIIPKVIDPLRDKINISLALRSYRKTWRPIVLRFQFEHQCPLETLIDYIGNVRNNDQNTPYLHMFMDSDSLLTLVSLFNRFK